MLFLDRLVKAFDDYKVPYALVGGVAVALHGAPRGTVDIDIVIRHSEKFFKNLESCMKELGFIPRLPVKAAEVFKFKDEYIKKRNLIAWSFYNAMNPIEVVDVILTHDLRDMKSVSKKFGLTTLKVIAIEDLIAMKKASDRPQDREDVKVLKGLLK